MLKIPHIYFTQYTIEDLTGGELLKKFSATEIRRYIDILVIDDEEFTVGKKLQANNFQISYTKDISNVKDVSAYQIILCDIRGVGIQLDSPFEGAFLIKEIKKSYPTKHVIAYTGSNYDASYNNFLRYADEIVKKGLSAEEWIDILDEEIEKCIDPIFQWKKVRTKLLEQGLSLKNVAKLESEYVHAIRTKNFDGFENLANALDAQIGQKGSKFISELLSSVAVSLIMKGIGL